MLYKQPKNIHALDVFLKYLVLFSWVIKSKKLFCLGKTYDESGDLIASSQICTFVVSAGGFGGKRVSSAIIPILDEPKRSPDSIVEEKTSVNQVIFIFSYFRQHLLLTYVYSFFNCSSLDFS